MAARTGRRDGGLLADLAFDLKRFHEVWMGLVYPRQVGADDTVLGKWKPRSKAGRYKYRLWGLLGAVVVATLYPVALAGTVLRFQVRRVDDAAARLGALGVFVLAGVVWGALALVARARFPFGDFLAVVAAGTVATAAAVGAIVSARVGRRASTVLLAYPLAMTGLFLPPVVAALLSTAVAAVVLPGSESLAIWILATAFEPLGLREPIHAAFDLVGVAYVLMWFALAVPVGWLLGAVVTLADVVRPTRR